MLEQVCMVVAAVVRANHSPHPGGTSELRAVVAANPEIMSLALWLVEAGAKEDEEPQDYGITSVFLGFAFSGMCAKGVVMDLCL